MRTPRFVERHSVALFILITVGLSAAAFQIPLDGDAAAAAVAMALVVPPAAASLLVALADGGRGLGRFWRSVTNWRARLKWYLAAIALAFAIHAGASLLTLAAGRIPNLALRTQPVFVFVLVPVGAVLEEIGWRGFALPRLIERQSPLIATLIIGIPWALIHLVLVLSGAAEGASPIAETAVVLALAFPITWVYIRSGRVVLVAVVLHAAINAFGAVAPAAPPAEALWFVLASASIVILLMFGFDYRFWTASVTSMPSQTELEAAAD